jgi:hypothetical protein
MLFFVLIVCCFLVRAFPRLILRNAINSDTYFHLYCSAVIREHSFRLPEGLPRVMLKHAYTYPFLYHYLLALFPLRYRLWAERLTGAIFDTLSLILVFLFALWISGQGKEPAARHIPIMLCALFAFSPAFMRIGSGPRAYNGSARVIGQMFYLLHLLAAYYAFQTRSFVALGISLLAGAALIITTKFGTQVLLLFGMWFGGLLSPYYFFMLAGCFLLSIVLTKGHAWKVILGHVRHSIFYARHLQTVFLYPHIRTAQKYLRSGLSVTWAAVRFFRFGKALRWYYSESYFPHLLVTVFPQFLLIFTYISWYAELDSPDRFLVVWMGAAFFCFLLAKLRPFLFLGEGERYLEYGLFPSLYLVVKFLPLRFELFLLAFLIYSILSTAFFIWQYIGNYGKADQEYERTEALFSELNRSQEGVVMPIGSFHYQVLYRSRFLVLTHGGNIDERLLPYKEFELVYGNYPYPSRRFREILCKYHVCYIVTDPIALKYYREEILKQPDEFDRSIQILWHLPTLIIGKVVQ